MDHLTFGVFSLPSSRIFFCVICFIILQMTQSVRGDETETETEADHSEESFTNFEKWFYAILTGIGLGLVGFVSAALIIFIKKYTKIQYESFLKVFIAFAAGALIGDAFIHLIPEAFASEEEAVATESTTTSETEEAHSEVSPKLLSFFVCLGVFVFALLERLFFVFGIAHSHGDGTVHHHHHDHQKSDENGNPIVVNQQHQVMTVENIDKAPQTNQNGAIFKQVSELNTLRNAPTFEKVASNGLVETQLMVSDQQLNKEPENLTKGWKHKKPEALLNQLGDFIHNIMDGIALGVAFSSDTKEQIGSTIIAIFAHEIPQEMGNASILMSSNFSAVQAMLCNGFVNLSAIIGIIIGLIVSSLNETSNKIMSCFVAGNFIYIGASEMMPKLSAEKQNPIAFAQLLALIAGFGVMFLVLLLESEEGHSH